MIKYIHRYIKTFLKLTNSPTRIVPPEDLHWTDGDRRDLAVFMESPVGKRFTKVLQNIEAESNARAILEETDNLVYASGSAFGVRSMLAHVFSLSAIDLQPTQGDEYEDLRRETGFEELEKIMSQQIQQ